MHSGVSYSGWWWSHAGDLEKSDGGRGNKKAIRTNWLGPGKAGVWETDQHQAVVFFTGTKQNNREGGRKLRGRRPIGGESSILCTE